MIRSLLLIVILALSPLAALAVQPDEMLPDPAQEARARAISAGLRCLVCRNESIDESNADLARDLRILVRERIAAGDSDDQVVAYLTDRYGEYVLLTPRANGANLLLWLSGPALLLLGAGIGFAYVRGRRGAAGRESEALSAEEARRLKEILGE
jgi:cytochrome c-type biogenesis protein CcmH